MSEREMRELKIKTQQLLRLRRQGIAMASYCVMTLIIFMADKFGDGRLSLTHWLIGLALIVIGNATFFALIVSNRNLRFKDPSMTWMQIMYAGTLLFFILYVAPNSRPITLMCFIPAFSFGMLRLGRTSYLTLAASVMSVYALLLFVEYLQGREGFQIDYELFLFTVFGLQLTWFAFFGGFVSNIRRRLRIQTEAVQKANHEIRVEIEERKKAQAENDELIVELKDALSRVKTLGGLLPICASCKKIRDDKGYWNQLELYIAHHTDAAFTHGICPDCAQKALKEALGENASDTEQEKGH